ncbi:MAG TPA: rRNA adenine N-6-methyltransferase family protein [Candidatus Desulfaltia sp.]|nr:rRNA adenine N-6-methyltransferase family protein [Candidatus Desulfaltia sp.]
MSLRETTHHFLQRHGIELDPSLDEQQLVDEAAVAKLVASAMIEPGDTVVEVGPGLGNITEALLSAAGRVIAVEKNPKYTPVLLDRFRGSTKLEIITGDALKISYPRHDRLVSNLPYMISEAMIQMLPRPSFRAVAFIVSESFGHRVTAGVGVAGYTKLSYVTQLYFTVNKVDDVPPDAYIPEPGTSTWIVSLKPREPETKVERVMRELLVQGDKLVKNGLREALIRAGCCETKREARSRMAHMVFSGRVCGKSVSRLSLRELIKIEEALGVSLQ